MTTSLIIVIAVMALGIIFMLIEIFLLPGISIAGVAGAIFLIGGIVYSYLYLGNTAGHITLAASAVLLAGAFVFLVKSNSLQRIALETNIEETVDNSELKRLQPGDVGVAVSRLNPIGKIMVNDTVVEGKSIDGDFINEDEEIEVVKVETYNVLVKKKNSFI